MQEESNLGLHPGVTNSIPARSHTFVKIDHEITSTVILLNEGLLSVTSGKYVHVLVQACPGKSVVR